MRRLEVLWHSAITSLKLPRTTYICSRSHGWRVGRDKLPCRLADFSLSTGGSGCPDPFHPNPTLVNAFSPSSMTPISASLDFTSQLSHIGRLVPCFEILYD